MQRVPWVRALGMMRDGTADLMSSLARTKNAKTFILYQAPAYADPPGLLPSSPPTRSRSSVTRIWPGTRIGFTRGSVYFEPFDGDNALNKLSATGEAFLRMLLGRRFDIVGSDLQVELQLRLRGFANEVVKAFLRPAKTTRSISAFSWRKSPWPRRPANSAAPSPNCRPTAPSPRSSP